MAKYSWKSLRIHSLPGEGINLDDHRKLGIIVRQVFFPTVPMVFVSMGNHGFD